MKIFEVTETTTLTYLVAVPEEVTAEQINNYFEPDSLNLNNPCQEMAEKEWVAIEIDKDNEPDYYLDSELQEIEEEEVEKV